MSDSNLHYSYKENGVIIKQVLSCDRAVCRAYRSSLFKNDVFDKFPLKVEGNILCQEFLESLMNSWKSNISGFSWEYEDKGKYLHELLKTKELLSLEFIIY